MCQILSHAHLITLTNIGGKERRRLGHNVVHVVPVEIVGGDVSRQPLALVSRTAATLS